MLNSINAKCVCVCVWKTINMTIFFVWKLIRDEQESERVIVFLTFLDQNQTLIFDNNEFVFVDQ